MELEIDEIKIKVTGIACVRTAPKKGMIYDLTISNVEIRDKREMPNDNQSETHIYTARLRPESELNLIGESEVILAKPRKGSQSQKLRAVIREYWEQQHQGEWPDFEKFYEDRMSAVIETYKEFLI
jgi:hypothetical protein